MPKSKTTSFTPKQMEMVADWVDQLADEIVGRINLAQPKVTLMDNRPKQVYSPEQPDVFFPYVGQAMLEDLIVELQERV